MGNRYLFYFAARKQQHTGTHSGCQRVGGPDLSVVAQRQVVGLATDGVAVQFPAGPLSRNIVQLSVTSLRSR